MAEVLDAKGLKCPQPILKMAIKSKTIAPGSSLEVHADCVSFEDDVKKWCAKVGKVLISVVDNGSYKVATIQF